MTSTTITISGEGMDIIERLRAGMESRELIDLFGLKFAGVKLEIYTHGDPHAVMLADEVTEAQPAPWSGDGLPPVGTECDVTPHNTIWGVSVVDTYRCTVLAYHDDFVWLDIWAPGVPVATRIDKVDFAPIKTPAQIAAEERAAAIEEMWRIYWQPSAPTAKEALGLLWDAGLRLPKAD